MKRRLVLSSYKVPDNGVYIQSVAGRYYTRSEWNDLSLKPEANGIALITNDQKVLISKDTIQRAWGPLQDVPELADLDYSASVLDFNGRENTDKIVRSTGDSTSYAAGWCVNYTFPDGRKEGYFPACGQWYQVYKNLSEISSCLNSINAEGFSTLFSCWSSSQNSASKAWYINRNTRDIWDKNYDSCYVRSFRDLI